MPLTAVIWDFDGTILDTEWPAVEAASAEFDRVGLKLDLTEWAETVGTANHEPWLEVLRRQAGGLDEPDDVIMARYSGLKNTRTDAAHLLPGVTEVFAQLDRLGLPCAVASSSSIEWVERHTRRHGLWHRFDSVATRTDVGHERTKPEPDLYLLAAERAGFAADGCLVIEDSHHGVAAAKAAGMRVIAVPNRITSTHDFRHADLVLESLGQLDLARFAERWSRE
jgi:HAD superfamily hydrolase (TIGR01509 family)